MATIPIEVIVQDVESPANPTPTPETNSTETSIAVPDTGAGTIGNSTFSSSSVASIIVPAVLLVLALATVCTLLIHRHHKHQSSKASKKEKLATATFSTIAVLAAAVLVSNLMLPATKAATSDTTDGITPSEDKISITVTRDGGSAEASIEGTATITSSSDFGYKVLLSMAEGADTANLYLDGNVDSEYCIAATESVGLADNAWGYSLIEDGEYSAVPLVDSATIVAQGDEAVEDERLSIYYGAKVSSDLPAGIYSGGEIEYNLVALEPTISTLTYMQDFAKLSESGKTSVLRSMTEDEQYYLKDNRDNKTYRIAKLKDGNVWMTQNLDLQKEDLLTGVTLDNTNTDNPVAGFELPNSQTSGSENWSDNEESIDAIHIFDIAGNNQEYHYCLASQPWGCSEWSEESISTAELGNLYNWYTATAGTGTSNLGENGIAGGSICPLGWKMPNTHIKDNVSILSNLLYLYEILDNEIINGSPISLNSNPFEAPLYFIPSGFYNNGLLATGVVSYFWGSAVAANYDKAYSPNFTESNAWLLTASNKANGNSVRCIAR